MTAAQSNKYHLRRWPASYYFPNGKKWISHKWIQGTLLVDFRGVTFCQRSDKDRRETITRSIPFSSMTKVRKATTTVIYSALVISTKDDTHWFSSLPNRDAAYAIIEHFWRERLIPSKPRKTQSTHRTKLGAELLQLTEDSEKTLQAAGTLLHRQGEQLDHAMGVMFDLQQDLTVAEKFISGFESWMGNWRLPQNIYTDEPIEIIDSKAVPTVYDFPVLFAAWSDGAGSAPKKGTLRISRDGLTIMDHEQINVYHYSRKGVSAIRVSSPWEMTVSKYLIGQPDVSYLLMSTHMVQVLKALEPLYRDQMDLVDPPPGLEHAPMPEASPTGSTDLSDDGQISPATQVRPLMIDTELLLPHRDHAHRDHAHKDHAHSGAAQSGAAQIQAQAPAAEIVTEEEAEELRDAVARMKSMAIDISNEQASQLEKIDSLTDTVDRATDRIKADTSRIKQLF